MILCLSPAWREAHSSPPLGRFLRFGLEFKK
jgi:hypothetical protein